MIISKQHILQLFLVKRAYCCKGEVANDYIHMNDECKFMQTFILQSQNSISTVHRVFYYLNFEINSWSNDQIKLNKNNS